jgi:hypothetical protein
MRKCFKCGSDRILNISGKTSDCFSADYKGKQYEGYVLDSVGISDDSDYIEFEYCLACGQIQGKFPVSDPDFGEYTEEDGNYRIYTD